MAAIRRALGSVRAGAVNVLLVGTSIPCKVQGWLKMIAINVGSKTHIPDGQGRGIARRLLDGQLGFVLTTEPLIGRSPNG